jgi:allose kinase
MKIETHKYVIGVDIGGTHLRIGAVNTDKELFFFQKKKIADILDHQTPIKSLADFLNGYIEEYVGLENVLAIGMGFPSVISKDKKGIHSTPNLECLSNINIVDPIQEYVHLPVYIENDVNYLLQYEISQRKIEKDEIVLGFYIGTGYGNSIYLFNQFLSGKNGAAGELGHIPALGNEVVCGCGNIGCIETYASGKRLVALHKEYFSDVSFEEIFTKYSTAPKIIQFVETLAIPIITEINIFDPHLVIIGGGVVGMKDFPKKRLEDAILQKCRRPFPANNLVIEYAEDTNAAGVLGASMNIFEKISQTEITVG